MCLDISRHIFVLIHSFKLESELSKSVLDLVFACLILGFLFGEHFNIENPSYLVPFALWCVFDCPEQLNRWPCQSLTLDSIRNSCDVFFILSSSPWPSPLWTQSSESSKKSRWSLHLRWALSQLLVTLIWSPQCDMDVKKVPRSSQSTKREFLKRQRPVWPLKMKMKRWNFRRSWT